jgi:hypothetical protein
LGLFKKEKGPVDEMTDPVEGTAKVKECDIDASTAYVLGTKVHVRADSDPAKWAPATMTLIVSADGVRPTSVDWQGKAQRGRHPFRGQTIPVTVDRADPHKISIKWSEMPTTEEALKLLEERGDQEVEQLESLLGDPIDDARQRWRRLLDQGDVTKEQYEQEMRSLDEQLRRLDES